MTDDLSTYITVPPKAVAHINAILQRRAAIEAELQQAAAIVIAAIGAPDGWQLRIEQDGSMVAVEAPKTGDN